MRIHRRTPPRTEDRCCWCADCAARARSPHLRLVPPPDRRDWLAALRYVDARQ